MRYAWPVSPPNWPPVASACCFLLSDAARAISGEILHVDGGFHAMGTAQPRAETSRATPYRDKSGTFSPA